MKLDRNKTYGNEQLQHIKHLFKCQVLFKQSCKALLWFRRRRSRKKKQTHDLVAFKERCDDDFSSTYK